MEANACGRGSPAVRERRALSVVVILLALTAAAAVWIQRHPPPAGGPLALELPDAAGEWRGSPLYYCQNDRCLRVFTAEELGAATHRCPVCGGQLDTVSLAERQSLPADTIILRKHYVNGAGADLSVAVVISGREQKSLHRPQQCLPAQGFVIERTRPLAIPLSGGASLNAAALDLRQGGEARASAAWRGFFVYWFTDGERDTDSYWRRIAWASIDRLRRRAPDRWAYVAIQTSEDAFGTTHEARVSDFVRAFYPQFRERYARAKSGS